MRRRVVERVEVVVHGLDLGTLGDPEAEAEEDVLDLAPRRGQQVQAADGLRRRAGQRDVGDVGEQALLELAAGELLAARADERLERLARLVGRLAGGAALGGLELGDPAQDVGQLGLAPEVAHAQLLELGARRRGADRRLGLLAQLCDAVDHGRAILRTPCSARRARSSRPSRALSDSPAIGMCATRSQAATTSAGRPAALGADEQARPSAAAPAAPASRRRAPRARFAPRAGPRRVRRAPPAARTARPSRRARPWARTGPRSRARAPPTRRRRRAPSARSCRRCRGPPTPHSATHSGPLGADQRCS